jgi:hypothetical protein
MQVFLYIFQTSSLITPRSFSRTTSLTLVCFLYSYFTKKSPVNAEYSERQYVFKVRDTKFHVMYLYVIFIVISKLQEISAARILAFVWQRTESHFPIFETLLKALTSRGHEVVLVSHFPQKTPVKNYTDMF